jgi:hypothetical protein
MHSEGCDAGRRRGLLEIDVECYAGYRGEETPRQFSLHQRVIEVTDVLDAWFASDHRYFKIRGNDCAWYILRNAVSTARWELTMYDSSGAIGGLPPPQPGGAEDGK